MFKVLSDGNIDKRVLRNFGLTIGAMFAFIGALLLWRGKPLYPYLFYPSAIFILLAFSFPTLLKHVYLGWMAFSYLTGWIMTNVILTILFYSIFTPVSIAARCLGKSFLAQNFNKDIHTYWIPKENKILQKSRYENQF